MRHLKLLILLLIPFLGYSQVQNFQMEKGTAVDQFLVTGTSPFNREFKSPNDVKTILGIPTSGAVYTDDQTIDVFSLSGTTLSLSLESDGQATQTVDFTGWDTNASDDFDGVYTSLDFTGTTGLSDGVDDNTQLSQEQVQDFSAPLFTGGSHTLISYTYNDVGNAINSTVNDDLSLYDNTTSAFLSSGDNVSLLTNDAGYLTSEVDGSTTNELQTLSYGSNAAGIEATISLSDGGGNIEFNAGTNITISDGGGTGPIEISSTGGESTTVTDGNTIDFTLSGSDITGEVILDAAGSNILSSSASGLLATEVDGSTTNELQNITAGAGGNIENGTVNLDQTGGTVNFATEVFTTGPGPFTLSNSPTFILNMLRNGVNQDLTTDYTVSGADISLVGPAFSAGEVIKVTYVY